MSFPQAFVLLYQPDSPFILHLVKYAETPESGITRHYCITWKSFKFDTRWQTYVFKTIGLSVLNCFLAKKHVKKIVLLIFEFLCQY